ncbi:MAG: hypothetical protein ACXABY_32190 [Candidatus Thorarchaeota archaeon]
MTRNPTWQLPDGNILVMELRHRDEVVRGWKASHDNMLPPASSGDYLERGGVSHSRCPRRKGFSYPMYRTNGNLICADCEYHAPLDSGIRRFIKYAKLNAPP